MATKAVSIGFNKLLCPDLTASAKLVWLGLRLDKNLKRRVLRSPTRMQRRIGVSRPTIRKAFRRFSKPCYPQVPHDLAELARIKVHINPRLIADKTVPAMARVVYCVLLGLNKLKRHDILSSYAGIARVLHLQPRTVRSAILALVGAGWLAISQATQRSPIHFNFTNPVTARQSAELRRAEQRLNKATYYGEALALLWCDVLVDSTNRDDDFFPKSFTNPLTGELLQADRYYVDYDVAIEFNGPQHDGATDRYPAEVVAAQMERDRIKREICKRQGIPLITLGPEDLSLERLRDLLSNVLPLRPVTGNEPVILHLEKESKTYRERMRNIGRQP